MLELRRGEASAAAVRAAYKRLALALHPDRNHARQAEAAFKRLQSAYEALRGGSGSGGGGGSGGSGGGSGSGSGSGSSGAGSESESVGASDDDDYGSFFRCRECGEATRYGEDDLCEECAEELVCPSCGDLKDNQYEEFCCSCQAERRRAYCSGSTHRRPAASSGCSGCGRPYTPPPTYMGNRPLCAECRDDDDDFYRYSMGDLVRAILMIFTIEILAIG